MNDDNEITFFYLDDRLHENLTHWLLLMIGSLRLLEVKDKKVGIYLPYCKKYSFHMETFPYFHNSFIFYFDPKDVKGKSITRFPGEQLIHTDHNAHTQDSEMYKYLRKRLLGDQNYPFCPGKYIYITRKNAEKNNSYNANKQRNIENEESLIAMLKTYNFEIVRLEEYSLPEKIKLFNQADIILSPTGTNLVCQLFSSSKTKIIEISTTDMRKNLYPKGENTHRLWARQFNVPYTLFTDIDHVEGDYNMYVNIPSLKNLLDIYTKKLSIQEHFSLVHTQEMNLEDQHTKRTFESIVHFTKNKEIKRCALVGVRYGSLAKLLLTNLPNSIHYSLIDPYEHRENDIFTFIVQQQIAQDETNHLKELFSCVQDTLQEFSSRYTFYNANTSFAEDKPNPSLDLVIIDSEEWHSDVETQCSFWWEKLNSGGSLIITKGWAHYIQWGVEDFAKKKNIQLHSDELPNTKYPFFFLVKD